MMVKSWLSEILRDDINDIALLKVDRDGKELKEIALGNSTNLWSDKQ